MEISSSETWNPWIQGKNAGERLVARVADSVFDQFVDGPVDFP